MNAGLVLWPVALAMAAIVAALVRWSATARTRVAAAVVVFLLGMMAAMLAGVAVYFTAPSPDTLVVGIWTAAALMALSVFPVFALFLREARRSALAPTDYRPERVRSPGRYALLVAGVVLGAELLMGRGFALADGSAPRGIAPLALFGTTVAEPFFLVPMAVEMGLSLLWLHRRMPRDVGVLLASLVAMMAFAPPAFAGTAWAIGSATVTAGAMTLAILVVVRSAYVGRELSAPERGLVVAYLAGAALAGGGLALWAVGRGVDLFAAGMVLQMLVFFAAIVAPERFETTPGAGAPAPAPGAERAPGA